MKAIQSRPEPFGDLRSCQEPSRAVQSRPEPSAAVRRCLSPASCEQKIFLKAFLLHQALSLQNHSKLQEMVSLLQSTLNSLFISLTLRLGHNFQSGRSLLRNSRKSRAFKPDIRNPFACERHFRVFQNHAYSTLFEATNFSRKTRNHTFSTLYSSLSYV